MMHTGTEIARYCLQIQHHRPLAAPCLECITEALLIQREAHARIAESVSILADHEKACCGDIPEKVLREQIANAIRAGLKSRP